MAKNLSILFVLLVVLGATVGATLSSDPEWRYLGRSDAVITLMDYTSP